MCMYILQSGAYIFYVHVGTQMYGTPKLASDTFILFRKNEILFPIYEILFRKYEMYFVKTK